jgi:iron-sulfur cluster repair protein YtfE (RIC family)
MKNTKRHPGLQPFSRDHGIGLVCAQRLHKAIRATGDDRIRLAEQVRTVCFEVVASSLDDERRVLSSAVAQTGLGHVFQEHHNRLRDLIKELNKLDPSQDPGLGLVARIADALDDYVRWEENSLFPAIEDKLSDEELQQLAEITASIEQDRHRPTQRLHASVSLNKDSGHADTCSCCMAKDGEAAPEESFCE